VPKEMCREIAGVKGDGSFWHPQANSKKDTKKGVKRNRPLLHLHFGVSLYLKLI